MIKPETLLNHYRDWESMKERIKSITSDIADAQKALAKESGIELKAIKGDFNKYLSYQKNSAEFVAIDSEMDALTQSWCPAYQGEHTA